MDVEFCNRLFLAEDREGFILEHELLKDQRGGEAKWFTVSSFSRAHRANAWLEGELPLAKLAKVELNVWDGP